MNSKSIATCFIKSLIGAIAAGLVTWVIGHFTHPISTPATGLAVATGTIITNEPRLLAGSMILKMVITLIYIIFFLFLLWVFIQAAIAVASFLLELLPLLLL
jgi:hypothetical protein